MLAASFALTFQPRYMGDGLSEYLTMMRNCTLIATNMAKKRFTSVFSSLGQGHADIMEPRLKNLSIKPRAAVAPALLSLDALAPLCDGGVEGTFHEALFDLVKALDESPRLGSYSPRPPYSLVEGSSC
jgi:hypothetical protein